jgi:hypothetical protein
VIGCDLGLFSAPNTIQEMNHTQLDIGSMRPEREHWMQEIINLQLVGDADLPVHPCFLFPKKDDLLRGLDLINQRRIYYCSLYYIA